MKRWVKYRTYIVTAFIATSCKVAYTPPAITTVTNYLVVEGLITLGNDSTIVKLSRTVGVSSSVNLKPELKAAVTVESNQGTSYTLKDLGNGTYAAAPLNLSATNQYRLRIKTSSGSTYTSDFVQSKVTPPIDSVYRQAQPNGLYIGVKAHDASNNTRYYRWDYTETWQFTSFYESKWMTTGSGIVVVPRTNDIYHCWGNHVSNDIILASTAGSTRDTLPVNQITLIPSGSEKLSVRYSILIKQYALTKDGFDYWTLLRKNTAELGSIFDAQPSESIGNVHNVNNPAEPVIGFISTSSISQTRIYIDFTDLPKSYIANYVNNSPYNLNSCNLVIVPVVLRDASHSVIEFPEQEYFIANYPHVFLLPVEEKVPYNPKDSSGSHSGTLPNCVDCTLRGTNVKPAFWK